MALTAQQKTRIGELYYTDCKIRRGLTDVAIAQELMTIILNNPSTQHTTQITNFLNARKTDSQAVEAAAPGVSTATIAREDTFQAEMDTLVGAM